MRYFDFTKYDHETELLETMQALTTALLTLSLTLTPAEGRA